MTGDIYVGEVYFSEKYGEADGNAIVSADGNYMKVKSMTLAYKYPERAGIGWKMIYTFRNGIQVKSLTLHEFDDTEN